MHLLARDLEPKHISFIQSYSSEITLRQRPGESEIDKCE